MTTEAKIQITSTELGTLWMTYLAKSGMLLMSEYFKEKTIDREAQNIMTSYINDLQHIKNKIATIFTNEKAVIPIAFDEKDIII